MTLHAGGGIVPSPARPAIPGGFRPKVHFTVDSACFSSYGLRCGRLQAFVTKAGVRACVCAFLWRFRLFASSIVCALSPQVFFRLGANFKGDRILVLFFISLLRTLSHAAAPAPRFVVRTDNDALFTSRYTRILSSFLLAFWHV